MITAPTFDRFLFNWATQLLHTEEEDGCLRLTAELTWGLPPPLRTSLCIRECYPRLIKLLLERAELSTEPLGFIITGTSGVGNSALAPYIIQQLGKEHKVVFYQYPEQFSACGVVRVKFDFRGKHVRAAYQVNLGEYDDEHKQARP